MAKNEVAVFNPAAVPAFVKSGEISPLAKALAGGGGGFGKRLSIKGGVFRLIVDGKEVEAIDERFLDVVIVAAAPKIGRTWYAKKFTEDANQGPACWSSDGNTPDPSSAQKQAETCADCPQNIKGSGEGDTRACRYSQRIAVVLANDMNGDVMQLSLPAKSIFGDADEDKRPLQAHAKWLIAQGINPNHIVTRLRFDTAEESPKLYFKPVRYLTAEEYKIVVAKGETKEAHDAITMTVSQVNKDAPAPKTATAKVGHVAPAEDSAPAPEPAAAPVKRGRGRPPKNAAKPNGEAAPVAEPTIRAKPAAPEMAKSPALAQVLSEWDD